MRKLFTLILAAATSIGLWAAETETVNGFCTLFNSYTSRAILAATPSGTTLVDKVYLANNGSISNIKTDKAVKLSNGAVVFYLKEKAVVTFTFLGGSSNTSTTIKGYDFKIDNTTTTDAMHSIPEVFRAYTLMSGTTNKSCADWLNLNGNTLCADGTTTFYTFFSTKIGMTTKDGAIKSESKVYNLFTSMTGDYVSQCFTPNTEYNGSVTGVNDNIEKDFEITLNSGYYAFNLSTSNSIGLKSITFTSSTPELTGAWKIDEDTVTSTNIMQEAAAPTVPTFSVGATSGTPTSDNYTVAYSLKEGSTEGIFTYSESGISAISTTTAGSATIVATLTTKDDTKYLTPKTNTFEYTVTVSPAAAPTFTSVTPSATSVVRGTASTIVAVVAGTPTPTIQWYSNTTKSNEGGEEIDGATDLTLNLANAAVGTYYYYAVATNTTSQVNTVASAVQTITVAPKAPVLPASGSFIESKSITIAKADGEAEAAVIKYSTDGETWNDYSAAIELTGTTTIQAKVVQSGLESAVASATYTLIILDEQVDVTASTNWDWTAATNSSDVDLKANSEIFRNVDVLLSDISKGGYTAVAGLACQQALLMNGEFAYRNSNGTKMCQVNYLKINTSVAGKISIEYANTGNNAARTIGVKVDDGEYQYGTHSSDGNVYDGSDASKQKYVTDEFDIAAGSITIAGAQVSDKAAKMLRIRKVVFTAKYAVNCADAENGTLVADKALAVAGETVTLTINPAEGYELSELTVKDAENADVTVTDGQFTMPASNVTVTATFAEKSETPTSIDNTADGVKAVKRIENGQLIIEKNGVRYNAMGQAIR